MHDVSCEQSSRTPRGKFNRDVTDAVSRRRLDLQRATDLACAVGYFRLPCLNDRQDAVLVHAGMEAFPSCRP